MKTIFPLVAVLCLLWISSCQKVSEMSTFGISGISDTVVRKRADSKSYTIYKKVVVNAEADRSDYVKLSLSGLPDGMNYSIEPSEGYVPFSAEVFIKDSTAALGAYQLSLDAAREERNLTYSQPFTLTVKDVPGCLEAFEGNYFCFFDNADNFLAPYHFNNPIYSAITINPTDSTVALGNFINTGMPLTFKAKCGSDNTNILEQTIKIKDTLYHIRGYTSAYADYWASGLVTSFVIMMELRNDISNKTIEDRYMVNRVYSGKPILPVYN